MASSSIPSVKAALIAMLTARSGLAGVQVEWAHPGTGKIEPEAIFFIEPDVNEDAVTLGNKKHEELYTLHLIVTVLDRGDDSQAAELRMWALVAEVEEGLRADANLGGVTNLTWALVAGKRPANYIETAGRVAECDVSIDCRAHI